MHPSIQHAVTGGLACEACGRLPHPRRLRLTAVKLAAVLPVEALLHALVLYYHLSYLATVALLATVTTALVIWIVEPFTVRALRTWLHAPALAERERLGQAESLWRLRVTVDDQPGALQRIAAQLAQLNANILGLHVHPVPGGARDELVVATSDPVRADDLSRAVQAGGGHTVHVWPTSALALVDGQTKALSLAARVTEDPSELPLAAAELLDARVRPRSTPSRGPHGPGQTTLHLPTPWAGLFVLERADEPFTPAEVARAHRLAQIAEAVEVGQVGRRGTPRGRLPV